MSTSIVLALVAHDRQCAECRYVNVSDSRCGTGLALLEAGRRTPTRPGVTLRKATDRDIPGVVRYVVSELELDRRRSGTLIEWLPFLDKGLAANDCRSLERAFRIMST